MNKKRVNNIKHYDTPSKDNLIVDHIKDQLEEKMQASAMDINVFCKDGYVHMSGIVDVLSEKKMAESMAKSIDGVLKIENKITIAMDSNITDKHMEKEVTNRLITDPNCEELSKVAVKVEDGVANLMGTVHTLKDANNAMKVAAEVRGVKDVVNNIKFNDSISYDDATLNSNITQVLSKTDLNYADISHTAEHGEVTLSGFVGNRKDMETAKEIVMGIDGVRKIINRMKIRKND